MSAKQLSSVMAERSSLMEIRLNADRVQGDELEVLEKLLRQHPGTCRARLHLEIPQRSETILELPDEYRVAASEDLLARIEQIFGQQTAVLR